MSLLDNYIKKMKTPISKEAEDKGWAFLKSVYEHISDIAIAPAAEPETIT